MFINPQVEAVLDQIIDMIEAGKLAAWRASFAKIGDGSLVPINRASGKQYRGVNRLLLGLLQWNQDYSSNRWFSYNQAKQFGGTVRKGESGARVVYYKTMYFDKKTNARLDIVENDRRDDLENVRKVPYMRYSVVFNEDQIDGIERRDRAAMAETNVVADACEEAEALIAKHQPKIISGGDRACYNTTGDFIRMPYVQQFYSTEQYYSTLLHELVHWTMHPSRLNRDYSGGFSGADRCEKAYAFEELVAEFGSLFLCSSMKIASSVDNHASYIDSWASILRKEKRLLLKAGKDAQVAMDYLVAENTARPTELAA